MLHRFYPIVPDAHWVRRLVPLGVKTIQLRVKNAQADEIRRAIQDSLQITAAHNCQLIVNDYWRDAIDLGADFIHLGQEDLATADLDAIRHAGLRLGISTHSHEELAIALAAKPYYVALGPIYETKLKKMVWAPQGLLRVREWTNSTDVPLVAIGGLTVETARQVLEAGADSLAVVTDIVTHYSPEARCQEWLEVVGNDTHGESKK